jgi:ribosomal protein S18 acetylase RimI-like enzyme
MPFDIVEYDHSRAAALAKMWNESGEGWNGAVINETEESIRAKEDSSSWMHHWLAVEGDQVLGSCTFGRYSYDHGALYVATLNAHPAWHGKGIGKALVLRSVEETIRRKWPRVDLFTWAGNDKALPLYKKCGFMRDHETGYTHLMNFIPGLVNSALGARALEGLDWYADSAREIKVESDQVEEGGYRLYRYEWRKGARFARAAFEHYGRSLVELETERFKLRLECDPAKSVFGRPGSFKVIVESASRVEVALVAADDRGVSSRVAPGGAVEGRAEFEGSYEVAPIEREQEETRGYPRVRVTVSIDGEPVEMGVGRRVSFPASLTLGRRQRLAAPGAEAGLWLDAENNLPSKARFELSLASCAALEPGLAPIAIELEAGARASYPVPARVASGGVCTMRVNAVTVDDLGRYAWSRDLGVEVPTIGAGRSGRVGNRWLVGAGPWRGTLDVGDELNAFRFGRIGEDETLWMLPPELGKPYGEEFKAAEPEFAGRELSRASARARFAMRSAERGFSFEREITVDADGSLEQRFHFDPAAVPAATCLAVDFGISGVFALVPYGGRVVEAEIDEEYPWDNSLLDEPWIGSRLADGSLCFLTWGPGATVRIEGWKLKMEWDLAELAKGGARETCPMRFHATAFASVREAREYALGGACPERETVNHLDVRLGVERGALLSCDSAPSLEPVVPGTASEARAAMQGDRGTEASFAWDPESGDVRAESLRLAEAGNELVSSRLATAFMANERRAFTIRLPRGGRVETRRRGQEYVVENGELEFALDPGFSLGPHSLKTASGEWLATAYPERETRSWYAQWTGGLLRYLSPLFWLGFEKEAREARFFERRDVYGRNWVGVESTSRVDKDERHKGLTFGQRYATLPGMRAVRADAWIENGSGRAYEGFSLLVGYLDARADDLLYVHPEREEAIRALSGEGIDKRFPSKLFSLSMDGRAERLYSYATDGRDYHSREANTDPKLLRMDTLRTHWVADGAREEIGCDWLVFDERDLRERDFALFEDIPPFGGE